MITDNATQVQMTLEAHRQMELRREQGATRFHLKEFEQFTVALFTNSGFKPEIVRDFIQLSHNLRQGVS